MYRNQGHLDCSERIAIETGLQQGLTFKTENTIFLVEVKGEDMITDADVIAKKKRGIQYCEVASRWGLANGYKKWRYLFIPSKQVLSNSSFVRLSNSFVAL